MTGQRDRQATKDVLRNLIDEIRLLISQQLLYWSARMAPSDVPEFLVIAKAFRETGPCPKRDTHDAEAPSATGNTPAGPRNPGPRTNGHDHLRQAYGTMTPADITAMLASTNNMRFPRSSLGRTLARIRNTGARWQTTTPGAMELLTTKFVIRYEAGETMPFRVGRDGKGIPDDMHRHLESAKAAAMAHMAELMEIGIDP